MTNMPAGWLYAPPQPASLFRQILVQYLAKSNSHILAHIVHFFNRVRQSASTIPGHIRALRVTQTGYLTMTWGANWHTFSIHLVTTLNAKDTILRLQKDVFPITD